MPESGLQEPDERERGAVAADRGIVVVLALRGARLRGEGVGKFESWVQAPVEVERPTRAASLETDLLVPAGQALLTGILLGLPLAWLLADLAGLGFVECWAAAAAITGAGAWVVLLRESRRLLWAREKYLNEDLDGDGQVGPPVKERLVFMNRDRAKEQAKKDREAAEWASFLRFVRELPARGTTMDAWEGVIGRARFREWRDALIDYGLADWRYYREDGRAITGHGWDLVATVDEILQRLEVEE